MRILLSVLTGIASWPAWFGLVLYLIANHGLFPKSELWTPLLPVTLGAVVVGIHTYKTAKDDLLLRLGAAFFTSFLSFLLIIQPIFFQSSHRDTITGCKSNLKNIATALEMYSTDFEGRFPRTLEVLTPEYLQAIPSCPGARADTYSNGFHSGSSPDFYEIWCEGVNHRNVDITEAGYPQYNSATGLIVRP